MGFAKGSTHPTSPVVCLTGKSLNPVQPLREKYFASPQTQITFKTPAVSFPQEGRFAVVTDVGSGMRWTRQRQARKCWTKDADADGEVVWSWRSDAGVKLAGKPQTTV